VVVVAPATQSFDFSRTNQRAALAEQRRALEERMTSGNADTEQHQQHVHPHAQQGSPSSLDPHTPLSVLSLEERMTSGNADTEQHQQHVHPHAQQGSPSSLEPHTPLSVLSLEERMTSGNADTEQHQQHVHGLTTTRRFEGYMRADIAKTHFTHSR
jgi:uncharacterized protein YfaQ (DUF2300 family)